VQAGDGAAVGADRGPAGHIEDQLVFGAAGADRTEGFRQPQVDAVVGQDREGQGVLSAWKTSAAPAATTASKLRSASRAASSSRKASGRWRQGWRTSQWSV
jgi:hypothetical protein